MNGYSPAEDEEESLLPPPKPDPSLTAIVDRYGRGPVSGWGDNRVGIIKDKGRSYYERNGSFGITESEIELEKDVARHAKRLGCAPAHPYIDLVSLFRLARVKHSMDEIADYFGYTPVEFTQELVEYPILMFALKRGAVGYKGMIREGQYQIAKSLDKDFLMRLGENELGQDLGIRKNGGGNGGAAVTINMGAIQAVEGRIASSLAILEQSARQEGVDTPPVPDGQVLLNGECVEGDPVDSDGERPEA